MIIGLLIAIAVVLIALWMSVMVLWWQAEEGLAATPLHRDNVLQVWNKAARLARRSWYNSLRHSKTAATWSNKKVTNVFIAVFPQSKSAFTEPDPLTGLEHGPSSYFLANLTRVKPKITRKKKVIPEPEVNLSEE